MFIERVQKLFNALNTSAFILRLSTFFAALIFILAATLQTIAALSPEQKSIIDGGSRFFDYADSCGPQSTSQPISSLYILGDSITVAAETEYKRKFTNKGITATINAAAGRSWTGGGIGTPTAEGSLAPAREAVEADTAKIQNAQGVVVALGSNGGLNNNPIEQVISAIRQKNPTAEIWWVNTAGTTAWPHDLAYLGEFNQRLAELSSTSRFNIIDWFKIVSPGTDSSVSPTNDPSGNLRDGLHPTQEGITSLTDLVVNTITLGSASAVNQNSSASAGTNCSCAPGGSASLLPGNDNKEKVWNFLVGTMGFTAPQAAGIMGNIQAESEFNPIAAYPGTTSEYPHGRAWGLAQWLGGRQTNLINFARERRQPVNSLELQLEFLKKELEEDVRPGVLSALRAATTVEEATYIFLARFESPCSTESACRPHMGVRLPNAVSILAELGGSTPSNIGTPGCHTSASLPGVTCPAVLEPHPQRKGYFKLPDAPAGEYTIYSTQSQRYGSQQLVCVLYSVALAFNNAMQGKSKLRIGDLNAAGHKSHNTGIAVDLSGEGELQVASHTKSWKGRYDKNATITLGKLFADTGVLRNIWWCPPRGDDSLQQILSYAQTKGLEGQIKCISGHADHFHVDIKKEFQLEFWEPA